MKLKIGIIALAALFLGVACYQCHALKKAQAEREVYKNNTEALLSEVQRYEVYLADTLQVVSLPEISLRLSEYERFRVEDAHLIESLKADNKRLAQVTATQTQTINQLKNVPLREKIVEIPIPSQEDGEERFRTDTLRCLDVIDPWFELHGCIDREDRFSGTILSRDSLLYVEHIVPKRFLGFLWKYGIRERRQEIVSRNPNTEILYAEFVTIRN
jgi:hypothetical protein